MPVQFPTLSTQEQVDRVHKIAKSTLFPYSFPFRANYNSGNFPNSSVPANTYSYFTMGFQSPNNLAVSILEVDFTAVIVTDAVKTSAPHILQVSYSPVLFFPNTFAGTPPVVPTPVPDIGNIIYNRTITIDSSDISGEAFSTFNFGDFHRFEPYNYLVKFNQILYIHVGVDPNILNQGGAFLGSFILHTLETGVKS